MHHSGNEDDFIIISLVRTKQLGFLKDLRRTNVMLTRCKKGMYIVCNRSFLGGKNGSSCLAGKLMQSVGENAWITRNDIEDGNL
jgi:regulator of nonsense transcripts 1